MKYPKTIPLLLVMAGMLLGAGCATVPPETRNWEYKIVRPAPNPDYNEKRINELANDGWIVDFFHLGENATGYILLKRQK